MLTYNTHLKKLVLPEYGRNIQKMVDFCKTIENRDERTACAKSIIETMDMLFPAQGDPQEYRHKLWDHLAIMSDFDLDIDWPYQMVQPDQLHTRPEPIPLPKNMVQNRVYGKSLVFMVQEAATFTDGEEKDALILLLANHMKKQLLALNPDGVDDERVFDDLRHISGGAINLKPGQLKLYDFKTLPVSKKKKKK